LEFLKTPKSRNLVTFVDAHGVRTKKSKSEIDRLNLIDWAFIKLIISAELTTSLSKVK